MTTSTGEPINIQHSEQSATEEVQFVDVFIVIYRHKNSNRWSVHGCHQSLDSAKKAIYDDTIYRPEEWKIIHHTEKIK